jgi:acetyl esterase/lipase
MELNFLVYPAPSYPRADVELGFLEFVAREGPVRAQEEGCCESEEDLQQIPVSLHLLERRPVVFYLHANGEDMASSAPFVREVARLANMGWLILEYPGYSVYRRYDSRQPLHQIIEEDAVRVYDFLTRKGHKVVVLGRSIGTGPALWLSSVRTPAAQVLLSPFKSLQAIAIDKYGFLGGLVQERFNNLARAERTKCPTLVIHGERDTVVPWSHGKAVHDALTCRRVWALIDNMEHSQFEFLQFFRPFLFFMAELCLL